MRLVWEFNLGDLILLLALVAVALLFFFYKFYLRKTDQVVLDRKVNRVRWEKIEELLTFGKEMNYKLAVIEADKLLDTVLKESGYGGTTMAERLKQASFHKPKLKEVWWAHKVRNCAVHDINYVLKHGETAKVLSYFKKALKELNAL